MATDLVIRLQLQRQEIIFAFGRSDELTDAVGVALLERPLGDTAQPAAELLQGMMAPVSPVMGVGRRQYERADLIQYLPGDAPREAAAHRLRNHVGGPI